METTPFQLCKGFPKEFEKYVEYTRNLEFEQDPDYDFLKNLFNNILKEDKNSENGYDWDIGNKTLNTITTNNTSQKAFFVKDKDKFKKEINILDNNNFIDMENLLDNEINEFEENENKPKLDKIEDNKFSIKGINTNEGFYNSQIIRSDIKNMMFKTEENINYFKKFQEKEKNDDENFIVDSEYKDIMEMTEEGKEKEIRKFPNTSGFIHSKSQLENNNNNNNNLKKEEEANNCIII